MFMKTNDAGGDVVRGKPIQPCEQSIASWLLLPFQDREVICIQQHGHGRSPFDFFLANKATEAGDFSESRIAGKDADDFTVPALPRSSSDGGFQLRQFLFNTCQPCFKLVVVSRHENHYRQNFRRKQYRYPVLCTKCGRLSPLGVNCSGREGFAWRLDPIPTLV